MINKTRLNDEIKCVSAFGMLPNGGITRLAFSDDEKNARDYVKSLMQEIGMIIREDAIGNIIGRIEGELSLPSVASGSHLDSVPLGGFYDGTLGVMCALEAIRSIKEHHIVHKRPFELIIFSCEESSRFNMATVGSKVMSGKLTLEKIKALRDKDGISIYDAAKDFGCNVDELESAKCTKNRFYSYLELHIEQGPVLENRSISVGFVTGIAAPIRYELVIVGKADHSGATPMSMRKDALVCASEIIFGIEDIAANKTGDTTVATVGFADTVPGVLNVIPGKVTLGIDIRDIDNDNLGKADKLINELIEKSVIQRGLMYTLKQLTKDIPTTLDREMIMVLRNEANALGVETMELPSGAGHDAMHMNKIAHLTGMIFVPCKDGISHNIAEEINMQDIYKATNVLMQSLITLSNME